MINQDGSIQLTKMIKGENYRVIETDGTMSSVWDAKDTIINSTTGVKKTKTRKQWKTIFDKFN